VEIPCDREDSDLQEKLTDSLDKENPMPSVTETGDDDVAYLFGLDEESVMAVWRM
jgi:hypothetical protein